MLDVAALTDPPPPWGRMQLAGKGIQAVRLGPTDLWLRYQDGEIWMAQAPTAAGTDPAEAASGRPARRPPEDIAWSRWVPPAGEGEVLLRPVFPDRALVLEPERPFRLLPGAQARIYVRVPLWVRVELPLSGGSKRNMVLEEFPAAPLSDTWWGGFMDGELAYWLPTTARREMHADLFAPHLGVCPLLMTNRSDSFLSVEKLAFRVAHLSIFTHAGHLWSDESNVVYQALSEGSQIEMTGRPPAEASDGALVTFPRTPVQRTFRARTFHRLLALPGLGGV
jgi:hypothetical protein